MNGLEEGKMGAVSGTELSVREEAEMLMSYHENWSQVLQLLTSHFQTIQSRTQTVLTLATLTLTITGFSGPKIAASNLFSRASMILGLVFVLSSILLALWGTLKIYWLTSIRAKTQEAMVIAMVEQRNRRTGLFRCVLILLVIGLTLYVSSVVAFLLVGMDRLT